MASPEPRLQLASANNLTGGNSDSDPLVGTLLADRYRLFSLLGEGGMGRVYFGEHALMHKRVAVKILHRELTQVAEVVARFEREAMAAANIDHPNVAAATDFGKLPDGSVFLVLEYVQGKSLRELLRRRASARQARVTHREANDFSTDQRACAWYRAPRSQARKRDARREERRP